MMDVSDSTHDVPEEEEVVVYSEDNPSKKTLIQEIENPNDSHLSSAPKGMSSYKDPEQKFTFTFLGQGAPFLVDKENLALLEKWCLKDTMKVCKYRFDQQFQNYEIERLFKDFFANDVVTSTFEVLVDPRGRWGTVARATDKVLVKYSPVQCTELTLSFFDKLYKHEIVRENGGIMGCFPEYIDGFEINQEIGKLFMMEESDNYDLFNEKERSELLFRILEHLYIGGPLNQYEDNINPYLKMCKAIYRDLISVVKDPKTNSLLIQSSIFKVQQTNSSLLFPKDGHRQNFLYFAVNPASRTLTVWYNAWCGD